VLGGGAGGFRQHAGVGVGGQGDGGVAELVLNDLEVGSRGQGDGGGAVPQPVRRVIRSGRNGVPVTVVNAYPAARAALPYGDDQVAPPAMAGGITLLAAECVARRCCA